MRPNYSNLRRIKDMVASERPQERLEKLGPEALSDGELLAMILRSGPKGVDVVTMSAQLLHEAKSLKNLLRWSAEDFRRIHGIGQVKALQLIAVMNFAKRILIADVEDRKAFDSSAMVARHFRPFADAENVEHFWVLSLNRKNRLLRQTEITKGTATNCLTHPREVFREAIRLSATGIIAVHNHPSGDPSPSHADIRVTQQLQEAAQIIGIDLLDHVIVGTQQHDPKGLGYYSFEEAGLI